MEIFVFPCVKSNRNSFLERNFLFINEILPYLHLVHEDRSDALGSNLKRQYSLLYFHGNAEDLQDCYSFLSTLKTSLELDVYAMEYPGYGKYRGSPTAKKIKRDALLFYDTLKEKIQEKNIIVFGRSIGTGPATYVASHRRPAALILMSPFTSIKKLILSKFCPLYLFFCFLKEHFNNAEEFINVVCPTFIVHGKQDAVIGYNHSRQLISLRKDKNGLAFHFPKEMTHNNYELMTDIIIPIKKFFETALKE